MYILKLFDIKNKYINFNVNFCNNHPNIEGKLYDPGPGEIFLISRVDLVFLKKVFPGVLLY